MSGVRGCFTAADGSCGPGVADDVHVSRTGGRTAGSHRCAGLLRRGNNNNRPSAKFTYVVTYLAVAFNGSTSERAVQYQWTFGDGGSSQLVTPTHTYAAPGI